MRMTVSRRGPLLRHRRWVFAALLAVASTSSADVLEPGTRLCVEPLSLPFEPADDPRRARIEARVVAAFEGAGFEVVEPREVEPVLAAARESFAGVVDPLTGRIDHAVRQGNRDATRASLEETLGCDSRAEVAVVALKAPFVSGVARWDGTSQQVVSLGRIATSAVLGFQETGWVMAFSIWIRVRDLDGNSVAFRSAGIETLVDLSLSRDKDLLPDDVWLTDDAKLDAALASAFGDGGSDLRARGDPHRSAAAR